MVDTDKTRIEAMATVGELILISNALDYAMAEVLIDVIQLTRSEMLLPLVMTLDPARKIEILKARADHISQPDWKKGITGFVKKAEKVFKYRNIAAHTQPILENGVWFLRPVAAAKLLKNLNVEEKSLAATSMAELREAISVAEVALGDSENIRANFRRAAGELARRKSGNLKGS